MGTRSLTFVHSEWGKNEPVLCMYRQFDGYPEGIGQELAKFLKPFTITNGISGEAKLGKSANGMGCLAAQLVSKFKDRVGNVYLYPTNAKDVGEEFVYRIRLKDGGLLFEVYQVDHGEMQGEKYVPYKEPKHTLLYSGTPDDALKSIRNKAKSVKE